MVWGGVYRAPAEIFIDWGGASLKKAPHKDKRGAERPHLVKKVSVREKRPPHREK